MCGRITLSQSPTEVSEFLGGLDLPLFEPRYNIAPTQNVLCVREPSDSPIDREAVQLRWGLVPSWAKDLKFGSRTINARGETVAEKPAFRSAFQSRRCVVVADGFYEWKKEGKQKLAFHIRRAGDEATLLMAGLHEQWRRDEDSQPVETCTIITTSANETMQSLHHRMPVFLSRNDLPMWLDRSFADRITLQKLLRPCGESLLELHPVSSFVNRVSNQGPQCLAPDTSQPGDLAKDPGPTARQTDLW